ncbi:hypothetical protein, partial [Hoeflea sp.]|uniref:hypothetical protein n=1 Tax=Hoeflea sp. TaxID=1940281 RepID=UPI0019BBE61D
TAKMNIGRQPEIRLLTHSNTSKTSRNQHNPAHRFDGGHTGVQLGADSSQHTEIRSLSWKDAEDRASLELGITARWMTAVG